MRFFGGRLRGRSANDKVGIVLGASTRGARVRFGTEMATARSQHAAQRENWTVIAIGRQLFAVAVGDGAGRIDETRRNDGADDLHFIGAARGDAGTKTDRKSKLRSIGGRQKHSPFVHKSLKLGNTIPTKTRAHIGSGIILANQVGSFRRVHPREWIAPRCRPALNNSAGSSAPSNGRK